MALQNLKDLHHLKKSIFVSKQKMVASFDTFNRCEQLEKALDLIIECTVFKKKSVIGQKKLQMVLRRYKINTKPILIKRIYMIYKRYWTSFLQKLILSDVWTYIRKQTLLSIQRQSVINFQRIHHQNETILNDKLDFVQQISQFKSVEKLEHCSKKLENDENLKMILFENNNFKRKE
ncbi:hypothetical protein RFI_06122 [Reticulomyxa filosa]|uniref:Uncharacterized protein n=1 Tax=Reticulomyxa filosa TaxID=46433 RepID=X6NYN1_RETFI|nr:hypothetical protein RFI_06122 [Reticulomyxa filosa]|eukprot:ETO30998.1 hypothetical protein RFI_06122 [Reticulomyxa filosa]